MFSAGGLCLITGAPSLQLTSVDQPNERGL